MITPGSPEFPPNLASNDALTSGASFACSETDHMPASFVTATKRAWLVQDGATWLVAGSFSGVPVPLNATAPPGPGFSAHTTRLRALAYAPAHAALCTVELSEVLDLDPGRYIRARRQRLAGIEFVAVCLSCDVPTPADGVDLHRHHERLGPGSPTIVAPACTLHHDAEPLTLSTLQELLSVPVAVHHGAHITWAVRQLSKQLRATPPRCWCAHVTRVNATEELFDDMCINGHATTYDRLTCLTCGAVWDYDNDQPGLVRSRAGDPGRAHNVQGRSLGRRFGGTHPSARAAASS